MDLPEPEHTVSIRGYRSAIGEGEERGRPVFGDGVGVLWIGVGGGGSVWVDPGLRHVGSCTETKGGSDRTGFWFEIRSNNSSTAWRYFYF